MIIFGIILLLTLDYIFIIVGSSEHHEEVEGNHHNHEHVEHLHENNNCDKKKVEEK
jgi:hypothetical protein